MSEPIRKRWSRNENRDIETPEVDAFVEEVLQVCRKHGIAIRHEDIGGAFVLSPLRDETDLEWFRYAMTEGFVK